METKLKILITGCNGQLGSEIKEITKDSIHSFYYHDIDTLDISNLDVITTFFKSTSIDIIVNCAAYTAVDKAETDEETANKINFTAVKNLSQLAKEYQIKLIHISTDYVFDGMNYKPYKEDDAVHPISVYGMSKLKGEYEVLNYKEGIVIRTSWLYSSYGNNFVKTILRLASEKKELNIIYDQTGTPTYACDLASCIIEIINQYSNDKKWITGMYHFSNEGVCSWYDFALEIIKTAGIKCKINPIEAKDYPLPAKRPFYSVLNKSKIKTNYQLSIPYWKDSLVICINKINK